MKMDTADKIINSLSQVLASDGRQYVYVHHTIIDGQPDVVLRHYGNRYMVQHGHNIAFDMDFEDATHRYGQCIFESLMSAGRLA